MSLRFYLLEEEEDEIKKKYDTSVYECVSSTSNSDDMRNTIERVREKSKNKKSDSYRKEHDKVKSIESLTSRYRECDDGNDNPREDKKYLKNRHKLVFFIRGV